VQAPELTAAIGGRGLTLARRGFLAGVGGVVFAFSLPAVPRARAAVAAAAPAGPSSIGAWIAIDAAGVTTIQVGSSEMGQGVLTSLAQIVAEELCVDWPAVRAQHSPASTTYGNPAYGGQQVTGGSYSVRGYYDNLRLAGAAVKYLVPGRRLQRAGVPGSTLLAGGVLGVVGFFVVPVVGLFVGFVLGVYLAELQRVGLDAAWPSTRAALRAAGLSLLIELAAGLLAAAAWLVGAVAV
jgi:hypothetical protein